MSKQGANLLVVEQAFGKREFQVTDKDNPMHLQLRTDTELWHKENMINLGINRLSMIDPSWEYVAWVDVDLHFNRDDIILETAQQLQHYDIVQMFSNAIDLDPNYNIHRMYKGFAYMYHENNFYPPHGTGKGGYYLYGINKDEYWHPGFAWAARREAIDKTNILDRAILGAGDHHMALSLIGIGERSLHQNCTPEYKKYVMSWQHNALHAFKKNIGYVPGTVSHYWHGSKINRKYWGRWNIINNNKFDPITDLTTDSQGMYKLNMGHGERSIRLRNELRQYFRQRNEDCIYIQ